MEHSADVTDGQSRRSCRPKNLGPCLKYPHYSCGVFFIAGISTSIARSALLTGGLPIAKASSMNACIKSDLPSWDDEIPALRRRSGNEEYASKLAIKTSYYSEMTSRRLRR